jgi:hypothetical protein
MDELNLSTKESETSSGNRKEWQDEKQKAEDCNAVVDENCFAHLGRTMLS